MNTHEKLGQTKITSLIFRMSAPAIFSMLMQSLYNIVDSWFLAKYNLNALSAVSLAFPIQMIIISLFVGLGVGINSVISRRMGEKKHDEAVNSAEHGFFFGFIIWIFLLALSIKLPHIFFAQFTQNEEIVAFGTTYISIILIFSISRIMAQVFISILQATGDMMSAMFIQGIGAIANIVLDAFLIFGLWIFPEMGVAGAAIATVAGQFMSLILALIIYSRKKGRLKLNLKKFHLDKQISKNIMAVGLPAMVMQGIGSIMLGALNKILSQFGDDAYTLLGVYFKTQSLIFMPVFGLCQGMMPVLGYNYGAGNKERVLKTLKVGLIVAVSIMLVGTAAFQFFPRQILSIFSVTESITKIGVPAFRIISSCFVLAAVSIVLSTFFQAIGDAYLSMIGSITRQLLIIIPAAIILSRAFGLRETWFAFPISEVITVTLVIIFAFREYRRKIKHLTPIDRQPDALDITDNKI
ncbi:MAG: MATE family efflux transporter [Clostridia bacterium]|nr:MATE family efflux transporter [Clostridia bacterium]